MPTSGQPILTIQTASIWTSDGASTLSGTDGPQGFDPFGDAFGGPMGSADIASTPFNDTLSGVAAGDLVTFVIAIQNFSNTTSAYGVQVVDTMPAGFIIPFSTFGADVVAHDGAGNQLQFSGSLFTTGFGITLAQPLAPYSDTSGANIALITFTLQADTTLAEPAASISNSAQIIAYDAVQNGPNVSGSSGTPLSASTPLTTAAPTVTAVADQSAGTLTSGHTDAFDVTLTLPGGTVQNLTISQLLPNTGGAAFSLVSTQVLSVGADIAASLPAIAQSNGTVSLGTVTDTPGNAPSAADQIVLRVTVADGGTAAGTATLNTTVTASNPNYAGTNWSTTVASTSAVAAPDIPPTVAGISPSQVTTASIPVLPFAALALGYGSPTQTQTLTIQLGNPALGSLAGPGLGQNGGGSYTLTGPIAGVQAAARQLVFTPTAAGTETFALTLDDGLSGVTSNSATTLAILPAANPSSFPAYAISPQTVLTSSATGTTTTAQAQSYSGIFSGIQNQFLYDGAAPIAVAAQSSGLFLGSSATATAVQLASGTNVVDITAGSGFVTSGSGIDTFLLHADQAATSWDTLNNFHGGDTVTIYGVHPSANWYFVASAGAAGYTGATLRVDNNNDGVIDASVTFAGKSLSTVQNFGVHTGTISGVDYLQFTA